MATKKVTRRKAAPKPAPKKSKPATKKSKPAASKKASAGRKPKRYTESALLDKYPYIVARTLRFEEEGKWKGKQTVEIRCQEPGCKARRRVATSDLFQVRMCEEHVLSNRRARRRKASKEPIAP